MQIVAKAVGLWLFLIAVMAVASWPWKPQTALGWGLFMTLGPTGYLAGETIFCSLFSRESGLRISRAYFSGLRVAIALVSVLLVFGAVALIERWLTRFA